jgi:pimeloyl-ACP methyl ester carboxylesterase
MKSFILISATMIAAFFLTINLSYGQTSFVTSPDSIRIAYEMHGAGEPALIFVHSWSCDRSYWKGQLETFSKNFKVVAIDLAGHGESGLGRKGWTIESFGADVSAVVEKLGLKRVILIGHSMGGDVIAEAARQLPGRVAGLIMIDTYKTLDQVVAPSRSILS